MKRGDFLWGLILAAFSAILIIPATHQIFVNATNAHSYVMGFFKFAILASMGELLAIRIVTKKWKKTKGMLAKAVVWGVVGILIVLMFSIFSNGVAGAEKSGLLFSFGSNSFAYKILHAFLISAIMNLTFAPVFMATHRISDTYIDLKSEGSKISVKGTVEIIDWHGFIKFVIFKTVPFFWIPAHTITFILPPEYRVIVAAYLSIALGIILAYAKRRQV